MKKVHLTAALAAAIAIAAPAALGTPPAEATPSGTAISTADDLKAMESNPSGSYYLAKDIAVPSSMTLFTTSGKAFKGTLDGNGHKLSGYKYTASSFAENVALFKNAKGATFKNLTVSNVDIQLNGGGSAAGLVARAENCKFKNVSTSGKIIIKSNGTEEQDYSMAAGLVLDESKNGAFDKCTNSINITLTHIGQSAPTAAGIVRVQSGGSITNCINKGKITITHTPDKDWGSSECSAAGITMLHSSSKAISGCKNTASLSITGKSSGGYNPEFVSQVAGIAITTNSSLVSCMNSGRLTVTNNATNSYGASMAGIACEINGLKNKVSKCSNSGAVSYTGKKAGGGGEIELAGVTNAATIEQSYNKGKVSVNSKVAADVGGVSSWCADMRNCYNTGAIVHKGTGNVGGLAGQASVIGGYVKNNYSTGKVSGSSSKKLFKGQLIGYYRGGYDVSKRNIFDNYYTASGKAYGGANYTWKPWLATAKKVSGVTSGNCPKLASKYWTYSSKCKRLVLKANREK